MRGNEGWALGPKGQRDGAQGVLNMLYTYSTVSMTTVFPASSETIENVLSDRKSVCARVPLA